MVSSCRGGQSGHPNAHTERNGRQESGRGGGRYAAGSLPNRSSVAAQMAVNPSSGCGSSHFPPTNAS